MTRPNKVVYSTDTVTGRMRETAREGIGRVYEAPIRVTDEPTPAPTFEETERAANARSVIASYRNLIDTDSGRIDNWSDR